MTQTERKPKVSFIGIGLMGSRMAARLLTAGFPVTVWNRSADKCTPLEAQGARAAGSIGEAVADAEIVITMLAGAAAIEEVYFGPDGVVSNAPMDCLLIDMSSLAPDIATATTVALPKPAMNTTWTPPSRAASPAQKPVPSRSWSVANPWTSSGHDPSSK